jgi:carboxyl-terminal processing protease
MLSTLDPHTIYVPPAGKEHFLQQINGNYTGIGVYLEPGDKPGETECARRSRRPGVRAGIESGDVFTKVDGENVIGLSPDELKTRVQGPPGTTVRVTFRRYDGSEREFVVSGAR